MCERERERWVSLGWRGEREGGRKCTPTCGVLHYVHSILAAVNGQHGDHKSNSCKNKYHLPPLDTHSQPCRRYPQRWGHYHLLLISLSVYTNTDPACHCLTPILHVVVQTPYCMSRPSFTRVTKLLEALIPTFQQLVRVTKQAFESGREKQS